MGHGHMIASTCQYIAHGQRLGIEHLRRIAHETLPRRLHYLCPAVRQSHERNPRHQHQHVCSAPAISGAPHGRTMRQLLVLLALHCKASAAGKVHFAALH